MDLNISTSILDFNLSTYSGPSNVTSEDFIKFVKDHEPTLSLSVYFVLCITGSFFSIMCMVVLTRPTMRSCSLNVLLTVLEFGSLLFNLFYLQSLIIRLFLLDFIYSTWFSTWFKVLACVCPPFMIFFNWITASISLWKVMAIAWPLRTRNMLTTRRAILVVSFLIIWSVLLSAISFVGSLSSSIQLSKNGLGSLYDPNRSEFAISKRVLYLKLKITSIVLGYLLPFFICLLSLLYLSVRLCRVMRNQGQLKEGQTQGHNKSSTIAMIILLSAFLLSYTNPVLLVLQQMLAPGTLSGSPLCLGMCLPVLVFSNLNFFIHYVMSVKFKQAFRLTFSSFKCKSSEKGGKVLIMGK